MIPMRFVMVKKSRSSRSKLPHEVNQWLTCGGIDEIFLKTNLLRAAPFDVFVERTESVAEFVLMVFRRLAGIVIERDLPIPWVADDGKGKVPVESLASDAVNNLLRSAVSR